MVAFSSVMVCVIANIFLSATPTVKCTLGSSMPIFHLEEIHAVTMKHASIIGYPIQERCNLKLPQLKNKRGILESPVCDQ
jgi:hypothetical protein